MLKMMDRREEIVNNANKIDSELEIFQLGNYSRYTPSIAQKLFNWREEYGQLSLKISIVEKEISTQNYVEYVGVLQISTLKDKKILLEDTVELNPIYNEITSTYDVIVKKLYGLNILRNNWRTNALNNVRLNMIIGELDEENKKTKTYHNLDTQQKVDDFNKKIIESNNYYLISDMNVKY